MKTNVIFLLFASVFLFFAMAFFIAFLFVHHRGSQKKNEIEKERMRAQFREELLKTQLEIQEQAFRNISQEIHDNIGQSLSIAKMNLGILDFDNRLQVEEVVDTSRELVGQAIRDLRDLSHTLHPEYVSEKGLLASLQYEAEMVLRTRRFEVGYHVSGDPYALDGQKELILFRVFQEALGNVLKHSGAKSIRVEIVYEPTTFSMSVTDDGQGFQPGISDKGEGLGLKNMRNRADLIGGAFSVDSTPGIGTTVTVLVPVKTNNKT